MVKNIFLRNLRLEKGFSQEFTAEKIGISRQTYIEIEKGNAELSLSQASKIADLFGVSLENFVSGKKEQMPNVVLEKESAKDVGKLQIRISVPQKNLKKFKEVFLYILEKVGSKPNIGETVLNKLLYFIDFDYYEKYEKQLIGATYIKNHFGPTPCELKKIVDDMKNKKEIAEVVGKHFKFDQKKYLPLRKADLNVLSAQEKELIDDVLVRLSDKNARQIADYSHGDIPYKVHKDGEKISYESVLYRDDKYSVRNYNDEL